MKVHRDHFALRRRRSRATALAAGVAVALGLAGGDATAMTLREAVDAALAFEPAYQAARHEYASAAESVPIARAGLLPQVSLSAATSRVTGWREFPNQAGQDVALQLDYRAPTGALQLRQPLFNLDSYWRFRQAEAQKDAADVTFRARGLDLVDRIGSAYIQTLLACATWTQAQTEVRSLGAQFERAKQRTRRGEGTRIDEAQAAAALEMARYRVLEAWDQIDVAAQRLQRLTGQPVRDLRTLAAEFVPEPPRPSDLGPWLADAESQNLAIELRRRAVEVAQRIVDRSRAGHAPRLDFVASMSRSSNDSISNLNQTYGLRQIGVQLSVPLYAGGGIDASVRQALEDQQRTEEELRNERVGVANDVQRYHTAMINAVQRVEAQARAVASAEVAVEGLTRARAAGLATEVEVLDARTRLFAAQRDLLQSKYEYLVARMRLQTTVGTPFTRVVDDIDSQLVVPAKLPLREPSSP